MGKQIVNCVNANVYFMRAHISIILNVFNLLHFETEIKRNGHIGKEEMDT